MKISNPLTIVAIFAGIAEAFATGALVMLPIEIQREFVYFVMMFPLIIVIAFFFILVTRPQVLYAPSDYSDENHFIMANGIENILSAKTEKIVASVKRESPNINPDAIKQIRTALKNTFTSETKESFEQLVLDYLKENPDQPLTTTGVCHVLSLDFRSVVEALQSLESKGLVVRSTNPKTSITLWQKKI